MKTNLANKYTQGNAAYPVTIDACVRLLNNYLPVYIPCTSGRVKNIGEVAFMENGQRGRPNKNKNNKGKSKNSKEDQKATKEKVAAKEAKYKANAEGT